MKSWALTAFFAATLANAVASDPPGYQRIYVGTVQGIVPEGVIIEAVNMMQIHVGDLPAGVDHVCFFVGLSLVRGLHGKFHLGQRMEIMVSETEESFVWKGAPGGPESLPVCLLGSENVPFELTVDWDHPSNAPLPPNGVKVCTPAAPAPGNSAPASLTPSKSPTWAPGSLDDPVGGAHP